MLLDLRYYGDPILRAKAEPVKQYDEAVKILVANMLETMRAEKGVGLAAQQIGITDSICVVDVPAEYDLDGDGNRENPDVEMPLVLLNPVIADRSPETSAADEGCLSFPGISAPIERACRIDLTYRDLSGAQVNVRLQGFVARVVQHEVDHLQGVLFTDRMSRVKLVALSGKLKRMRRETREELGIA